MLKASWTGLACFSTKQLTLLAVASVKASVHNNPSRIHWVCHNITFQDWSSKYEKNNTTWAQFDKNPRSLTWVSGHHHSDLHSCHLNVSGDIQHKSNKSKSLVSKMFTWRILGRLGDLGSTTFGGFLDLIRPFQQLLKQCWNCAFLWPFFFEAVKFQHRKCYRNRHRFSTGPRCHSGTFPSSFSIFRCERDNFPLEVWASHGLKGWEGANFFQAGIILKAANKENLGHMFVWKNNLEGWDFNKKVVKCGQEQEIVKSFSDNPGPKALSIPWTAGFQDSPMDRLHTKTVVWLLTGPRQESPSISFSVFGYFRILSTLSNVQTHAQCLPTWQLYLSFQTFQVQLQSSKQSNRVLQIIAFIVSFAANTFQSCQHDGWHCASPCSCNGSPLSWGHTRWRKHEVDKKW